MARSCPSEIIARLYHTCQVTPGIGSGIPGDRAGADGEVDIAACEYPSAVISSGGSSRAARWQIGDRGVVPGVGAWIVAIGFVRGSVATARVDKAAKGRCHEAVVSERVVCSHRPGICGNIVNLDMKIGADGASCDAIDFAVEVRGGVEVGGDCIGRQGRVISIADRIVPPKRGGRSEVLVHAAKQVDIGAVACSAKPATRCRKRGDGRPCICRGRVLISVCDGDVVGDPAEAINIATLRG